MTDAYQTITDQIIADIETGKAQAGDWIMPWHKGKHTGGAGFPVSLSTGKPYRGINVIALWSRASRMGYQSNIWGTFKQWKAKGAMVKKGEKATKVVFWKQLEVEDSERVDENGQPVSKFIPLVKAYAVFNADQVDGYDGPDGLEPVVDDIPDGDAVELPEIDAIVKATGADIRHGGDRACYVPMMDAVFMPPRDTFRATEHSTATEGYYSTLFHELAHWTGAEHRLDRIKAAKFGDSEYAFEELVAELSAAFTCATVGVSSSPRPDHAQYIASWLKALKSEKRFIFEAAKHATKATDMVLGTGA